MYRVCKDKYVCNVFDGVKNRTFYSGETLPENYEPPIDYTSNDIVEKIEIEKKKNKKEEVKEWKNQE